MSTGAPQKAMIPSPMNLSMVPFIPRMIFDIESKYSARRGKRSSMGCDSEIDVKLEISEKKIDSSFFSPPREIVSLRSKKFLTISLGMYLEKDLTTWRIDAIASSSKEIS